MTTKPLHDKEVDVDEGQCQAERTEESEGNSLDLGVGIALGISLGGAIGVATDSMATGLGLGLAMGIAMGAVWEKARP